MHNTMKIIKLALFAAALIMSNAANAQSCDPQIGDTIEIDGVKAQILTLDDYGEGIAISKLSGAKFCVSAEITQSFPTNSVSDGRKNTAELLQFIEKNDYGLANFPYLRALKQLGDGWYIPASNEIRQAIIESTKLDWDIEDDLDYSVTYGDIKFKSPLAFSNSKAMSSTVVDGGKMSGISYWKPVSIYSIHYDANAEVACYAFHTFSTGKIKVVSKSEVAVAPVPEPQPSAPEPQPAQQQETPQQQTTPAPVPAPAPSKPASGRDVIQDSNPVDDRGYAMSLDYLHGFCDGSQSDIISMDFGANIISGLFLGAGPQVSVGGYSPFTYGMGGQVDLRYTATLWNVRPYINSRLTYSYNIKNEDGGFGLSFGAGACFAKKYFVGMQFSTTEVEYTYYETVSYQTKEYYTVSVPYKTTETYYKNGRKQTRTVTKYRNEQRSRNVTKYCDEERTGTDKLNTFLVHFGIMF